MQLDIRPIPLLRDNYAWALLPRGQRQAVVVDPGEKQPVLDQLARWQRDLAAIWLTHHHDDHIGGVGALLASAQVEVVGAAADAHRLPPLGRAVGGGDAFVCLGLEVQVMATAGHTRAAVSFYLPQHAAVFTGDTLFVGGCGRLFEGDAQQMLASLQALGSLPPDTRIYCGHEYTLKNARFALSLLPKDPDFVRRLAQAERAADNQTPTVPQTLAQERRCNIFLRLGDPVVQAQVHCRDPLTTLAALRCRRDAF